MSGLAWGPPPHTQTLPTPLRSFCLAPAYRVAGLSVSLQYRGARRFSPALDFTRLTDHQSVWVPPPLWGAHTRVLTAGRGKDPAPVSFRGAGVVMVGDRLKPVHISHKSPVYFDLERAKFLGAQVWLAGTLKEALLLPPPELPPCAARGTCGCAGKGEAENLLGVAVAIRELRVGKVRGLPALGPKFPPSRTVSKAQSAGPVSAAQCINLLSSPQVPLPPSSVGHTT